MEFIQGAYGFEIFAVFPENHKIGALCMRDSKIYEGRHTRPRMIPEMEMRSPRLGLTWLAPSLGLTCLPMLCWTYQLQCNGCGC